MFHPVLPSNHQEEGGNTSSTIHDRPKIEDIYALVPGTWDHVTWHGKKAFTDVMIKAVDLEAVRASWLTQVQPV